MRSGQLTQLSHDHTFVQSLVDEGRISADEAFSHPHRNLILRVLDGRADSDPDLEILDVTAGDRLMLCSDGLPDYVRDADIAAAMADGTPDSVVVDLVTRALEAGSNDNVTCVVADVVQIDQPSGPLAQPQLVGAAAELAQGGTGRPEPTIEVRRGPAAGDDIALGMGIDEHDLEALRYAPQPPKRFGWARRIAVMVVLLALVGGAGWIAYAWTQRQYYVGSSGDNVAIFQGVDADLPGIELSKVFEVQTLQVDQLPTYRRDEVEATMPATSLTDAHAIVARLQTEAAECARQATPTPRPSTTPSTPVKPTTPGGAPSGRPTAPPKTTPKPTVAPTSATTTPPGTPGDGCG
jgi:PPM family protein phosphatase